MFRAVAFFVVLLLIGLFALLNWGALSALAPVSLVVTTVQAPIGLLMLGLAAFLCVLFTVWMVSLQAGALNDSRRQTRELQAQRELADKAEASRFTELRTELMARLDRLQQESRLMIEQSSNSLAAQIGELDDRLTRAQRLP